MMELGEASTVNVASASVFNTTQKKNPNSKEKGEDSLSLSTTRFLYQIGHLAYQGNLRQADLDG